MMGPNNNKEHYPQTHVLDDKLNQSLVLPPSAVH